MMMNQIFKRASPALARRNFSTVILRERMETVIADRQKEVMAFRKEHADTVIGNVTVS